VRCAATWRDARWRDLRLSLAGAADDHDSS
jgi:hypothetical protein